MAAILNLVGCQLLRASFGRSEGSQAPLAAAEVDDDGAEMPSQGWHETSAGRDGQAASSRQPPTGAGNSE